MKKNAIIAAIASLALVLGVTGTAVMLNGDKAITETSTSVVEGDSSTDNQSGNTDKAGDEKSESDSGEVAKNEDTTDKDEDREDADTTEKDSASTTNKNSGKSGVTTAASTPVLAESDAGSAQISGGTDSEVTTPHTDSSEQNQSSSEDTAQNPDGGSDSGSDGEEDKTPHTDISPADVVRLTNDERVKNGLEALETETAIQDAANIRAKEIATNFSHTRPDGTSFSTAISGKYSHTGENIAYSTGNVTAEKFVSMWMASSGHKANILGDYTGIVVGIYYDENSDTTYAVQLFVSDEEDSQYTYTDTVVPPTCTEQGYTLHTCNEDASKTYKDNYTAALGHDWDGANLGATCRRCSTPLFVFDHTVDATCQDGGYDVYVSVADPSQTRMTNFTDPIDHIYENGFCIMCGEEEPNIPNYDDNYDKNYYNNTIISLTNQARESRGLSSLSYASEYQAAADIRAQEIVSNFSHTRPNGSGPETTLDELGCEYSSVGENIAYVASMYKPNKIVENWLASPGHASNMLSSTFDSFVVGTACSDGRVYAVQLFFTDASADANSVQTMTLDEAEAVDEEAPAASESAEDIVPAPTEEPIELPEETTAPDEELEETAEETPSPVETPAPEVTPSPVETPAPEVTPSPEPSTEPTPAPTPEAPTVTEEPAVPEEVAPIETPAPEATPEPTEEPADAAPEESPIQEQDVITPPEETELVVPQMEEIPDDTPADAAE